MTTVDPANLSIIHYPDPILRTRCEPLPEVTDEVRTVARRMIEIMLQAPGLGLAAPQVGLPWRLFVCHVPLDPADKDSRLDTDPASPLLTATPEPTVYINPVLSAPLNPVESESEGCLSLPDITGDIPRPRAITIEALDLAGSPFRQTATGLLARCWQHEADHLDGVLILDRMSSLSRLRVRSAVRSLEKAAGVR
ncbi:Peptide deformylase [hydrothermal vent metagenome]|uniref:Peptide deformylase n=1 Tax=hydrothermal vent metagenome TaxID=652676 RepID=A0A3B1DPE8_9ZZZZ